MGECLAVNKIKSDLHYCQEAMVFNQEGQPLQDIIVAGEIALVSLHCGVKDKGLHIITMHAVMR